MDNRQFAEIIAELSGKTSVEVLTELIAKFADDHVFDVGDEAEAPPGLTIEPIEPIEAAPTEPTLPVYDEREDSGTEPLARHEVKLTPKGKKIADQIIGLYPDPVLILGPAGMGKSLLCRYIAKQLGINYTALNCSEGLREEHLVGAQYPRTDENGNIVLEWRDGGLTKSARDGGLFLFEEITRARKEISARLFGLLDTDGRYWPLQEHPDVVGIPVHKNFWFIATGNPPAAGYHTTTLDTALQDRFQAIYTIKEPLAPEKDILTEICGAAVAEGLMRFATDARRNEATYVNTRNLVQAARLVKRGIDPVEAVSLAVSPKYATHEGGLNDTARDHLAALKAPTVVIPEPVPETPSAVRAGGDRRWPGDVVSEPSSPRRPRRKRKRLTKAELEAKGWCNCYVCLPKRGYEVDTRNGRRIS